MAESAIEAQRVWSHKARLVLFISAMRHFRDDIQRRDQPMLYQQSASHSIAELLLQTLESHRPQHVYLTRPGDWHLFTELQSALESSCIPWSLREDPHFISSPAQFAAWAKGRKQLRMEYFYRTLRRQTGYLMTASGEPEGAQWNFDADNRHAFRNEGPGMIPAPYRAVPDQRTREVITDVESGFPTHPGDLSRFDWPVTRHEALAALRDFIEQRLALFGRYQDAMWLGETWLYHSRLAAAMNLHLISPREVMDAAIHSYSKGRAPLAAVEGFVRQILGWREFVRGLYWMRMPGWLDDNHFAADASLPTWYWTGEVDMRCLRDALQSTLSTGYAHHIQRLMVTGLFALLLGVRPTEVEAWYHAIYVDAVSWVELPNTLGMSQFADGGLLASKPYLASGAYIDRMSNSCAHCPYKPKQRSGDTACPFTVLYWDFLARHEQQLNAIPRMAMQLRNLKRLSTTEKESIAQQARAIRQQHCPPNARA